MAERPPIRIYQTRVDYEALYRSNTIARGATPERLAENLLNDLSMMERLQEKRLLPIELVYGDSKRRLGTITAEGTFVPATIEATPETQAAREASGNWGSW